jgi:hypothetical protein
MNIMKIAHTIHNIKVMNIHCGYATKREREKRRAEGLIIYVVVVVGKEEREGGGSGVM